METAKAFITKGTAWQAIESAAAQRTGKRVGAMTRTETAQAVSELLDTPEGARLYEDYLAEQDVVAAQEARRQRDGR